MTPLEHRDASTMAFASLLRCLEIMLAKFLLGVCQQTQWNRCISCGRRASIQLLDAIAFQTVSNFLPKSVSLVLELPVHASAHRNFAFLLLFCWIHGEAPWLLQ